MKRCIFTAISILAITLSGCSGGGGGGAPTLESGATTSSATVDFCKELCGKVTGCAASQPLVSCVSNCEQEGWGSSTPNTSQILDCVRKLDCAEIASNSEKFGACFALQGEDVGQRNDVESSTTTTEIQTTEETADVTTETTKPSVTPDTDIPRIAVTADSDVQPDSHKNSNAATIKFTVSEPATITCILSKDDIKIKEYGAPSQVDGGYSYSFSDLAEGTYSAEIKASDAAGHPGEATVVWTVDTTKPSMVYEEFPGDSSNIRDPLFKFSSNEDVIFECKLDESEYYCGQDYSRNGQVTAHVVAGFHILKVRSVDRAGNMSIYETYDWNVEILQPAISITNRPANPNNSNLASISFKIENPSVLEMGIVAINCQVSIDYAASVACSSKGNHPLQQNSDGVYTQQLDTMEPEQTHYLLTLSATSDFPGTTIAPANAIWDVERDDPQITSIVAAPNSVLSPNGYFTITFNEEINRGALDGKLTVKYQSNNSPVQGTLVCVDTGCKTFKFRYGDFPMDETILVTLDRSGFTDLAGNKPISIVPFVTSDDNKLSWKFYTNSRIKDIAAGDFHGVALRNNGTVWVWGENSSGQLGVDMRTSYIATLPQVVEGLSNIKAIAAGPDFTLAVKGDGSVWAWGNNYNGQLGNGESGVGKNQSIPVQVLLPETIPAGIMAVAAGDDFALALTSDRKVWAWGNNEDGQLGVGRVSCTTACPNPTQVVDDITYAPFTNVVAIAAGSSHSLALTGNGKIYAWGDHSRGQLGIGVGSQDADVPSAYLVSFFNSITITSIGTGGNNSFAITSAGQLYSWGGNTNGSLGDGSRTARYTPVLITTPAYSYKTNTPPTPNDTFVQGGNDCTFALKSDGTVLAWGINSYLREGQGYPRLGVRSTTSPVERPAEVKGSLNPDNTYLTNIKKISARNNFTMALSNTLFVYVWGHNEAPVGATYGDGGLGLIEGGAQVTKTSIPKRIPGL